MRFHFIGDKTDRLFSKGQKLHAKWLFKEAVEIFDQAIKTDPLYAHIYLYKGISLAESGQYTNAVEQIKKGAQLDPNNFVFPLKLGCVHLDEGNLDDANKAFNQALSFASGNLLVAGYQEMTNFLKGDSSVLYNLLSTYKTMPVEFKCRLLIGLTSKKAISVSQDLRNSPEVKTVAGDNVPGANSLHNLRLGFLHWRTCRLMRACKYDSVFELLKGEVELDPTLNSILQEVRDFVDKELTSQIDSLNEKSIDMYSNKTDNRKLIYKIEEQRRNVLLRIADLHGANNDRRFQYLDLWQKSFNASGSPRYLQDLSSAVLAEMAELARVTGRLDIAISLCQRSRAIGGQPEVDWTEGIIALTKGNQRYARWLLERFGCNNIYVFNKRIANIYDHFFEPQLTEC